MLSSTTLFGNVSYIHVYYIYTVYIHAGYLAKWGIYTQQEQYLEPILYTDKYSHQAIAFATVGKMVSRTPKGVLRPTKTQKKFVKMKKLIKLRISAWNDIKCNFKVVFLIRNTVI
jgi:hypothetical protein